MPTYDLYHTETGALIRSQVFAAQPANPAGKPWAWALQSKPADEVGSVVQWSTAGRDWVSECRGPKSPAEERGRKPDAGSAGPDRSARRHRCSPCHP